MNAELKIVIRKKKNCMDKYKIKLACRDGTFVWDNVYYQQDGAEYIVERIKADLCELFGEARPDAGR